VEKVNQHPAISKHSLPVSIYVHLSILGERETGKIDGKKGKTEQYIVKSKTSEPRYGYETATC